METSTDKNKETFDELANSLLNLAHEDIRNILAIKTILELLVEKEIITQSDYEEKFAEIKETEIEKIAEEVRDRLLVKNCKE